MLKAISPGPITDVRGRFTWSASELNSEVQKRMLLLQRYRVQPGDAVLIMDGNSISFFATLLAVWRLGACAVPADPRLPALALEKIENLVQPRLAVDVDGRCQERPAASGLPADAALILLTSGSTAEPKGVLHDYKALEKKFETLSHHLSGDDFRQSLCALPTFFGHGLICNSLGPWLSGAHLHIGTFDASFLSSFGEYIREKQISFFSSTPGLWPQITGWESPSSKTLKRVHCASAMLDGSRHRQVREWIGDAALWNVYGLTEFLGWVSGYEVPEKFFNLGDVGSLWDADVRFGESDEIQLRAPFQMRGYLGQSMTESQEESWFATGDQGYLKNGHLILTGRLTHRINKAGLKIQPEEIEAILADHASVRESCCFPLSDEQWGQKIGLVVVAKNGVRLEEIELKTWFGTQVAAYKIPDRIWFADSLPVDGRGKIKRREIAARFEEENGR